MNREGLVENTSLEVLYMHMALLGLQVGTSSVERTYPTLTSYMLVDMSRNEHLGRPKPILTNML